MLLLGLKAFIMKGSPKLEQTKQTMSQNGSQ